MTLFAPAARARADDAACGQRGWPWVWLAEGAWPAPFDGAFRARLVAQLGAGLEARHIQLCAAAADARVAADAASEIDLAVIGGDVVSVTVQDAVTGKHLARALALATVPADARPLTVALAIDELLRAGWVELSLPDAPAPDRPVPPEIGALARAAPVETKNTAAGPAWEIGAALAAERFGGGTRAAGVDLTARAAATRWSWVHATAGLRKAADVRAIDGVVRATVLSAELGAELPLLRPEGRWQLALGASGRLLGATLSGEPRADAHGGEETALAFYLGAGLRGGARLGRSLGVSLAAGFGVPLRGVDVYDGATRVAGLSGPSLSLALGASWRLP